MDAGGGGGGWERGWERGWGHSPGPLDVGRTISLRLSRRPALSPVSSRRKAPHSQGAGASWCGHCATLLLLNWGNEARAALVLESSEGLGKVAICGGLLYLACKDVPEGHLLP